MAKLRIIFLFFVAIQVVLADRAGDQTSLISTLTTKINSANAQIKDLNDKSLKLLTDAYNEQLKVVNNFMQQQETRMQKKTDAANADRVKRYPCLMKALKYHYNALSEAERDIKNCFINQEINLKQKLARSRVYGDILSKFVSESKTTCATELPNDPLTCVQEKLNIANATMQSYASRNDEFIKTFPSSLDSYFKICATDIYKRFGRSLNASSDDDLDACFWEVANNNCTRYYDESNVEIKRPINDFPSLKKLREVNEIFTTLNMTKKQNFDLMIKILETVKNSFLNDIKNEIANEHNVTITNSFSCLLGADEDINMMYYEAEKNIKNCHENNIYEISTANSLPKSLDKIIRGLLVNRDTTCASDFPKNQEFCLKEKINFAEQYVRDIFHLDEWSKKIITSDESCMVNYYGYYQESLGKVKLAVNNCFFTGEYLVQYMRNY